MISPCWGRFSKMDPRADPRSVTMRGGPSPSVVRPRLLGSLGPKALQSGVRTSRRGPSKSIEVFHLGRQVGSKFAFFAICLRFLRAMFRSCVFCRFPMVLEWILGGSGRVLGVFWKWFSHDFQKIRFFQNSVFPRDN